MKTLPVTLVSLYKNPTLPKDKGLLKLIPALRFPISQRVRAERVSE